MNSDVSYFLSRRASGAQWLLEQLVYIWRLRVCISCTGTARSTTSLACEAVGIMYVVMLDEQQVRSGCKLCAKYMDSEVY
jgi:hypothetical protein